jgi:large subunit ribosomal protein L18
MIKRNFNSRTRSKTKIRKKMTGTAEQPRLTIFRSLNNIYAQLVDDVKGETIAAASLKNKELADQVKDVKGKTGKSKLVGALIAKKALEKNINTVVFDRNGYRYHGRVQAVADGAREAGLKF